MNHEEFLYFMRAYAITYSNGNWFQRRKARKAAEIVELAQRAGYKATVYDIVELGSRCGLKIRKLD